MEKRKDKNIYIVNLIEIIKERIRTKEKFEINAKKVKTIKELKYYIINKFKKENYCPCSLIISEIFEYGLFCSDLNDKPNQTIEGNFKENTIYVNINSDKTCDCGFEKINSLSKIELYENFMEKIKKLILKYEIIINEKEKKIEDLEIIISEIINNIDKNRMIYEKELESKINEMKNYIRFRQHKDNIKFEDFYDLIININSIKEMNTGWDIKMNEKGKLRFEEYKKEDALIIGIIGNSNKGKSFLLSKISKINLPNGTNIKTEGLSIKYPELEKFKNRKIVLLDSEGFEAPFLLESNLIIDNSDIFLKDLAREKMITEYFLQDFIINNSDILISVVGSLTFQEQKFLNKLKNDISKLNLKKSLIVIHNLMTLTTIEQVKNYINNILLKSATFDLIKTTLISTKISKRDNQVEYFYESNNNIKIIHLIFANEGSEAGNFYNKFALEFIENSFKFVTNIKPFNIFEKLKERIISLSNVILENNTNYQIITKEDFLDNNDILKEKKFRLKNKKEITLKRLFTDELGFSNLRNSGFNPDYNYYLKNNKLILKIECPGNIELSCNHRLIGKYNIIEIKGIKNKDKEPKDLKDNIYNSREFGKFSIDIPLMIDLENTKPKIIKKEGLFIIEFPIKLKKNNLVEYKEEEEEEEI